MNKEHITDAIGMIDDNMLSHTDSLRKERRSHSSHKSMLRIIAAAAAVLTVAVCGVAGLAAIPLIETMSFEYGIWKSADVYHFINSQAFSWLSLPASITVPVTPAIAQLLIYFSPVSSSTSS